LSSGWRSNTPSSNVGESAALSTTSVPGVNLRSSRMARNRMPIALDRSTPANRVLVGTSHHVFSLGQSPFLANHLLELVVPLCDAVVAGIARRVIAFFHKDFSLNGRP